jgi:hypothetical protein
LGRALRAAPITSSADPTVWNGELPASKMDLDRQLSELVG